MGRPKQPDLPGAERVTDKKLENLADDYVDTRDQKADLAAELTAIETKILDRMRELGLRNFRFADKIMEIKDGKNHVKVKTVKVEGEDEKET